VDEPTGFDKIAWSDFGRRGLAAAVRSEAEDERPSPAASNPTLSAICDINSVRPGSVDRNGDEAGITPARAAPKGRGAAE
jgi:hypothetical protein